MRCEHWEDLLSPYLEAELDTEPRRLVEEHLKTCRSCTDLLGALRDVKNILTGLPEVELDPTLQHRLTSLPARKRSWRPSFDFFLQPSLQPVMAAATVFLTLVSFYAFHPERDQIKKSIDRQIHLGYSKIGQIYAKAEAITSSLGEYKDNILVSLQSLNPFEEDEDQTL